MLSGARHALSAFTIVEVLLASAITVLIVVMLGTMFGSLTSTTTRSNQQIDAFRDARAALQLMQRDVAGLVRTPGKAPYFAIDERFQDENTNPRNQQLYLLSAIKDTAGGPPPPYRGDLCAVGYYCKWENGHYTLRRYFAPSFETFNAFQTSGPGFVPLTAIYKPDTASAGDDLLAAYAWNLQLAIFDKTGAAVTSPLIYDESAAASAPLPAYVEVSFNAMSPQAARTAIAVGATASDWMDSTTSNHQRLIAPHKYLFRTRIHL